MHDRRSKPGETKLQQGCVEQQLAISAVATRHTLTLSGGATLSFHLPSNSPPSPPTPPSPPVPPHPPPSLPPDTPPSLPPPLSPPPPRSAAEITAALNKRFREGRPTNDVATAGVFVSQFDGMLDQGRPWLPCNPGSWCSNNGYADRFSGSVINRRLPNIYHPSVSCEALEPRPNRAQ